MAPQVSSAVDLGSDLFPYVVHHELGNGNYSRVFLCENKATKRKYAMKVLKPSKAHNRKAVRYFHTEGKALAALSHPGIVALELPPFEAIVQEHATSSPVKTVVMLTEYVPNSDMYEFLAFTGTFSEDLARTYFAMIVETVKHMHSRGIFHRDIKPENIVLGEEFEPKLIDLGFASFGTERRSSPPRPACTSESESDDAKAPVSARTAPVALDRTYSELGTDFYMAPEIAAGGGYDPAAADIWSLGVLLFVLLSSRPPFRRAVPEDKRFRFVKKNDFSSFWAEFEQHKSKPVSFSKNAKDLISKMLQADPNDRLSLDEVLEHPFFKEAQLMSDDERVKEMRARKLLLARKES